MTDETLIPPPEWRLTGDTDSHDDPLLDSLLLIAKLHGRVASRTGLRTGLPLVDDRLTVELFPRAAGRAGLSSRLLRRPLAKISKLELPAILLLKDRRACVLVGGEDNGDQLKVLLPESGMGETVIPRAELEELYSGYALYIRPKFRFDDKVLEGFNPLADKKGGWFWGPLFDCWRIYRDVLVASFLINVFGLTTPFFILNVYDRVIPNSAFETLWVLAIGIGIIYLFTLLMRALRGYFIDEAGKKINLQLSAGLFQKVLGLRMEVCPKSIGSFSKNLQQFESVRDFITSFSVTAIIDLPFLLLGLFAIWYLGGAIVFIFVAAIALQVLYSFFVQPPLIKAIEKTFQASAQKNAILVEGIAGLETIKMLGAAGQIQRAWEEAEGYIATWSARSRLISSSVNHVSGFIQSMTVVAVVIAGVYMISEGHLTQGGLIALVMLSRQALAPMAQVVNLATRFHQAKLSLSTLNSIMALPEERPAGKAFLHRTSVKGDLALQNVNFAYPGQSANVLQNINLQIVAGEKVGIVGPIGSGKTTLGKLLLGLYQPTSGMICVDGTDIRQIDPAELRSFIGYVPQDVTLFRGSVRDNITLGVHDVDDNVVLHAADFAGVSDFVRKHAMGFDMEVGELGRGLSGGQRKCVAIARAILLDPPVLVLDEPTGSMDNMSESRVKSGLTEMLVGKTMILITHRASLLSLVDRLIVIDNGTIVADGPRASVLEALKRGQINV
ncbi:MAG: type I secretion system permease/ATPase [Desulfobulbaceae bacterium]|nr:type I secretion system permease/ATPase [Desulfobulbaceae bacterium]